MLPQRAFAPQLNFIPKRLLARLQCAVADAIWQDRPKWRSKHLLLCVIHKAHKLDPFLFRAVATIMESAKFLQGSAFARQRWQAIYEPNQMAPQSWMTQFAQACHILDVEWSSPFGLSIFSAPAVDFLEFSVKDLKCILKSLAANKCYQTACLMPRKDIQKAAGFLDLALTLSAKRKIAAIPNQGLSFICHWESALTGCTLTSDRLAASGLVDSAQCRYCKNDKESLQHFVDGCPNLPTELQQPESKYYFGPNFRMLGVVEMPVEQIRCKLQVSNVSDLRVCEWNTHDEQYCHVWTDGSVQLSAVVAEDSSLLAAGRVKHWRLSSYSAELWAVLEAFAAAPCPMVIHTDSLTIVNQFTELLRLDCLQLEWTHAQWWGFFADPYPSPSGTLLCSLTTGMVSCTPP